MKIRCTILAVSLAVIAAVCGQTPSPTASPSAAPSATPLPPAVLESILLRPSPWTLSIPDMDNDLNNLQFQWLSDAKDAARSVRPKVTFAGLPVQETILRLTAGKLSSATLLYYDRAISKELSRPMFERFLADLSQKLTTLTGQSPVERGRDATSAVRAEGRLWQTPTTRYLLEWSVTRQSQVQNITFRAEFARLTIEPVTKDSSVGSQPSQQAITRQFVAHDHIVSEPSGDVKIQGVPMVDQGNRGYCVAASVERVLRYYGQSVNQQEIAQVTNSDSDRGTSTDAMVEALRKLTGRLGIKVHSVYEMKSSDFVRTIDDYNHAARRARVQEVDLSNPSLTAERLFSSLKPGLYKEVRLRKSAEFDRFQREVQRSIDDGVPLLWGVQIGLVPEKDIPSGVFGGHMRLIIGYNIRTKELIYSDSWGHGHEEKRMPVDDAWTITDSLDAIQPISS